VHDTVLGQSSFKKDFIWNIIGSVCAAGSSIIYLMVVTRVVGDSLGGIFSYAYASAQLMLTIGRFGMRAFQATDLNQQFSFASYLASRVITCALMLLTDLFFLGFSGYDIYKFQIMFWVCVLKMSDAIEDIFHGEMQQKGRLYLAGKLLAARNILSFLIFSVILIMTADLLLACLISAILSLLIAIIINIKFIPRLHFDFSFKVLKSLFFLCIPLFLSTFFHYIFIILPRMQLTDF
jgi:O-antigen/teichoic acid export membrane protein